MTFDSFLVPPVACIATEAEFEHEKLCQVCKEQSRQYKCPRCGTFTCSLKCCKQHKIETNCNGRRDRVAFVGIQEFKEKHLQSDFHFLEDVLQTKDSASRTLLQCGNGGLLLTVYCYIYITLIGLSF